MWCAAASASSGFERPGACSPDPYPSHAATHGSLCVIQWETRSPSRSATASAYPTNASAVERAAQPPSSSSVCGRSQWYRVGNGVTPLLEQLVDEPVVEVEPRLVHLAAPFRDDARPRDREAEGVEPELAHQPDVVGEAVVEVARDRAALAVPHLPRRRAEAIPDALAAAVLVDGAFDLVRRGRGAPGEIGWKRGLGHAACLLTKWSGRSSTSAVPAPRSPTLRPARAPSGACESPRSGCGTAESRSLV